MKPISIVVCIKPVPDSRHWEKITLDPETGLLRREGIPIIISPLDRNALEEALRIKENRDGKVTVISMGPPNTVEILTSALAMGADAAVLLTDRTFAAADTLATAYALASGIRKLGEYDLVLLGNESLDGSTGQVGPQVAEFLGIPHVTHVNKVNFIDEDTLQVKSRIELGYMMIEVKIPVALAVEKEINEPRIPSLLGVVQAKEKPMSTWSANDIGVDKARIGLPGSPTQVAKVFAIEVKRRGEVLTGEPVEVTRKLIEKLRAERVLPKVC